MKKKWIKKSENFVQDSASFPQILYTYSAGGLRYRRIYKLGTRATQVIDKKNKNIM